MGETVTAPVAGLADTLQTYGAWSFVAILIFAMIFLWRAYEKARDQADSTREKQVKEAMELAISSTATNTALNSAMQTVTQALQSLDERQEKVEKSTARMEVVLEDLKVLHDDPESKFATVHLRQAVADIRAAQETLGRKTDAILQSSKDHYQSDRADHKEIREGFKEIREIRSDSKAT